MLMTAADAELSTTLDELVAEGARRMLAAALEAEVDAYVTGLADERDEQGHRLVVRNGHAEARSLVTGAGPDRGPGPTGGRPPGRRGDRGEDAVPVARSCRRGPASPRRWPRCCR